MNRIKFQPAYGVALLGGFAALHLLWLTFQWGGEAYQLLWGNLLYLLPTLAATFVTLNAALRQRGSSRRGWLLIGLGLATLAVGNAIWSYNELISKTDPFPSAADLFFLLFGPLLAAGFFTLMPNFRNRLEGAKLSLDLAITLGAVGLYFWRFLLAPPFAAGLNTWMTSVSLAYPLFDLLLLSLLCLMLLQGRRGGLTPHALVLFGLGIVSQIAGDTCYNATLATDTYYTGHPLDALFSLSTLFYGLAAYAAGTVRWVGSRPRVERLNGYVAVLLPYLALALGFGLLLATQLDPGARDTLGGRGVLYGSVLVTLLVVVRQLLAFQENLRLTQSLGRQQFELKELSATLERKVQERTCELSMLSRRFEYDALHDALTGLPNRPHFYQRLERALADGLPVAVLYLDFDRFKAVNDSFGHAVGDALLHAIGLRLTACLRPNDLVARLGGDEFALLLGDQTDAAHVAERLIQAFETPLNTEGYVLHCTTSIGVVLSADEGNADHYLRNADIAMYRAKEGGRSRYVVFEPAMLESIRARLAVEESLRGATQRGEFEVFYQPIVSAASGAVSGFEALVRWRHPERGLVMPAEFIPVAEESGLIIDIDRWVLKTACQQLKAWQSAAPHLTLSVNLSSRQFARADLTSAVASVLASTGLAAKSLKLELTEGLLMEKSRLVQASIKGLRGLGVRLHIDDFGTGYSSLAYLQRFDADALKIDRSFVAKMLHGADNAELVSTIVNMAHNLGMAVVAEGVETVEQFTRLRALGCEFAQGYLFSKPVPAADVCLLLQINAAVVAA